MTCAALSMGMQESVHTDFSSFLYIHKGGIGGLYGSSIFIFWKSFHIVFHSECTNLHSYQHCRKVPFAPHTCQNLIPFVFLIKTIFIAESWCFDAVLTHISPVVLHSFSCIYWLFVLLLSSICSGHFLVFTWITCPSLLPSSRS